MDNLKLIRSLGWNWLTRLKSNRLVNLNRQGTEVWLPGFGLVKVFGIATQTGGDFRSLPSEVSNC